MMTYFETSVIDIIERTASVRSFRFENKPNVDFKAGQFFLVTIKVDGKDSAKHFSFSNSPTEKGYIEFTKRITDSPYSKALQSLRTRDWAGIKMPMGSFTFEGEYKKIAFLSGGIGITPIRSICKFVTDSKIDADIVLLYGNNMEKDIIFRQDLDEMAMVNDKLRVVYTLTSKDIDNRAWGGRTGYIDAAMVKGEIPDYSERVFFICGPPTMVGSLTKILKDALSVPTERIRLERFAGYL